MPTDEDAIRQLVATWLDALARRRYRQGVEPDERRGRVPDAGKRADAGRGYTLSILNKRAGAWMIARDANMLAPVGH